MPMPSVRPTATTLKFGDRFLADEVQDAGFGVCDRTVWKICAAGGWWSSCGKKKMRTTAKLTTPAHDDLVRRDFSARRPNQLWLHRHHRTRHCKRHALRVCHQGRLLQPDRRLLDRSPDEGAPCRPSDRECRRTPGGRRRLHSAHRPRQPIPSPEGPPHACSSPHGRLDGPGGISRRQRRHGELLCAAAKERAQPPQLVD